MLPGLFDGGDVPLGDGAVLLSGFALPFEPEILPALDAIVRDAPFRHFVTPGGRRMSVAMTSCGRVGWVSDSRGYRYDPRDPATGRPWPAMPAAFEWLSVAAAARAGYPSFAADSCLINRYEPGTKLSLHQDRDEQDLDAPIVSVSLGIPAVFLFGGLHRNDPVKRIRLVHGDVAVWGGPSRLFYHGIMPLADAEHPSFGRRRINLTFRKTA